MKCVACGGEGLVGGVLSTETDVGNACFRLADRSYWSKLLGLGSKKVRAHGCVRCGHLQLAVEFDEKDLRRFLEFEGQQPGVLERINEGEGGPAGRDD